MAYSLNSLSVVKNFPGVGELSGVVSRKSLHEERLKSAVPAQNSKPICLIFIILIRLESYTHAQCEALRQWIGFGKSPSAYTH